jgi:Uma2 family endonuclease
MTPAAPAGLMTAEEFYDWASLPENADRKWELEDGVPVEVPTVPSPGELHGAICWVVAFVLGGYLYRRGAGYICTNDTGLIVRRKPDGVRGPDVLLFLTGKPVDQLNRGWADQVPALVVEVFSPSDRPGTLNRRVKQYLRRGVPLVWVVYPDERTVDVYRPGVESESLGGDDDLSAPDVLPGFACTVSALFTLPGTEPAA